MNGLGKGHSKGKELVPRHLCAVCGKRFYVAPCILRRGGKAGKFCSYKCKGVDQSRRTKPRPIAICPQCGKEFLTHYCRLKTSRVGFCSKLCCLAFKSKPKIECKICGNPILSVNHKYCSMKCRGISQRGSGNWNWKPKKSFICLACGKTTIEMPGCKNRYCSLKCWGQAKGKINSVKSYTTGRGGIRIDLGIYLRSRWEANWARYLNWQQARGLITGWQYEPETFTFPDGTGSYTPDFKVSYPDGKTIYHEVKGYMDERSATKLGAMESHHPDVHVMIVGHEEYRKLFKRWGKHHPAWERDRGHAY